MKVGIDHRYGIYFFAQMGRCRAKGVGVIPSEIAKYMANDGLRNDDGNSILFVMTANRILPLGTQGLLARAWYLSLTRRYRA